MINIADLELKAERGYLPAIYELATHLTKGTEIPQDIPRAVKLFERAAERGCPHSLTILAEAYWHGNLGFEKSHVTAINCFYRAWEITKEKVYSYRYNAYLTQYEEEIKMIQGTLTPIEKSVEEKPVETEININGKRTFGNIELPFITKAKPSLTDLYAEEYKKASVKIQEAAQKCWKELETVFIEKQVIIPSEARILLEKYNINNRTLKPSHTKKLVKIFIAGEMVILNDCICFNEKGEIINGQHRLQACVDSNIPFSVFVAFGVPDASFEAMDTALRRAAANMIAREYPNVPSQHITTVMIAMFVLEFGHTEGRDMVDNSTVVKLYEQNKEILDYGAKVHTLMTKGKIMPNQGPVAGAVAYILKQTGDKVGVDVFANRLAKGNDLKEHDGIWELHNFCRTLKTQGLKQSGNDKDSRTLQLKVIAAWNKFATNGKFSQKKTKLDDKQSFNEFQMIPLIGSCPEIIQRDRKKVPLDS